MIASSVNTDVGPLAPLRAPHATNTQVADVQRRIDTGPTINRPRVGTGAFTIAPNLRGDVKALAAAQQGLAQSHGVSAVAIAAVNEISELIAELLAIVITALERALTQEEFDRLKKEFDALVEKIGGLIDAARFAGRNLLDAGAGDLQVPAGIHGDALTMQAFDLKADVFAQLAAIDFEDVFVYIIGNVEGGGDGGRATRADDIINAIESAQSSTALALTGLAADGRSLDGEDRFLTAIAEAAGADVDGIVDADLTVEAAHLAAQHVQQQLGVQINSIANAQPDILLALFDRG